MHARVQRVAGGGSRAAAALGCAFKAVSHQERATWPPPFRGWLAHPKAGIWRFTCRNYTELLVVEGKYEISPIGGSSDLNAGQFVDRVGVALGLPFPAGPMLEQMAAAGTAGAVSLPASGREMQVSFSGPCSAALRQLEAGARGADVALAVFSCIGRALGRLAARGMSATGIATLEWQVEWHPTAW